jgi:ABC-type nitrate/sulfonate/bicarbonate transport system substrate-binding protein
MEKIRFPYRSDSHLLLLHVVAESGSWEKYGLDVEYDKKISSRDSHDFVLKGDVEFVSGNHISPYARRARGDNWVYLGQTVNTCAGRKLVVRADSGIKSIADLREKVVGSHGSHPKLNDWLQLKQHGLDVDRDEVAVIDQLGPDFDPSPESEANAGSLWQWVLDKNVDAAFINVPGCIFAERAGLKVIEVDPLPMIYYTTLSTSLKFAQSHPDIVERFLKGIIEGIHFFKTQPEKTMKIIRERFTNDGTMDAEIARATYECYAHHFEAKLYPTMAAINNVYQEGIRQDKDAAKINPMELWDLHYVRQLDDSGFINDLYARNEDRMPETKTGTARS